MNELISSCALALFELTREEEKNNGMLAKRRWNESFGIEFSVFCQDEKCLSSRQPGYIWPRYL